MPKAQMPQTASNDTFETWRVNTNTVASEVDGKTDGVAFSRAPNSSDDAYPIGTKWIDTTDLTVVYVCRDNTTGNAIWDRIFTSSGNAKLAGNLKDTFVEIPFLREGDELKLSGLLNFSRSTTATYFDRFGVLQTASVDEPRFTKDGILIEIPSSNHITQSNGFDVWTGTATVSVSTNFGPDGVSPAYDISDVDNTAYVSISRTYSTGFDPTKTYTGSIFILKDSIPRTTRYPTLRVSFGGVVNEINDINFDTSTGEFNVSGIDPNVRGGVIDCGLWWRVWVSAQTQDQTNTFSSLVVIPAEGSSATWVPNVSTTGTITVFGSQLENVPVVTSYIPTTTTQVTRGGDNLWIDVVGNGLPLGHDISILADVTLDSFRTDAHQYIYNDFGYNLHAFVASLSTSGATHYNWGGGNTAFGPQIPIETRTRLGMVIESSGGSLWIDGVKVGTSVTPSGATGVLSKIYIGMASEGGISALCGSLRNFRLFDRALSDDEMKVA